MTQLRVLVTGGAGFLGSHLCDRLLEAEHQVFCVDNYSSGRKDNIAHLIGATGFEVAEHDVTLPLDLEVDQIFNLACPASPPFYQSDPVQTTKTSVLGAINLLDLARRCGARILQASTSEVYGDPLVHPQSESYRGNVNATGPRACYDEGKRCAEALFFDYHRHYGVDIKVMRIFNTYGPRMLFDDGRVVSNFIHQSLTGRPITVYGDGRQTRSFCYVDDQIDGMLALMGTAAGVTGPVNVGNPHEITILELAEEISALTEQRPDYRYDTIPKDDPARRCPDISAMTDLTGWQPRVPLKTGLARTVEDFRARLSAATDTPPLSLNAG
ncbi:MAG: UDP-glucuronic acid decarboxylase family protein [Pseudomonadota bacterium]